MNKIADIWQSINGSGIVVIAIIYLWSYVKPLIDNKSQHASTVQSKEMWQLLESVATTAVNSLISKPMTGADKFDDATTSVMQVMANQGFNITQKAAEMAVQSAYETMNVNPEKEKQPDGKTVAIDTTKEA